MKSLKSRMLLVLGATITFCWAIGLVIFFSYLTQSQSSIWDDKLRAIATKLLLMIPAERKLLPITAGLRLPDGATANTEELAFQIWNNRELLITTPQAPTRPLSADFREGFVSSVIDGERWRVFSISDKTGRVTVQVGTLHKLIDVELRTKALTALAITTTLLVLVGVLLWFAVLKSLKPLAQIEKTTRERDKFDFTPLPTDRLPTELQPLMVSFNEVLGRLNHTLQSERRFIGDAAHELRTPLAALQAHAQIALRAGTVEEKNIALAKLLLVVHRSARMSEQLLDLARLDAGINLSHLQVANLDELIVHVASEFDIQASQNQRLIIVDTEPCQIECDVDQMGILLRNLIDNSLRYTSEFGSVKISYRHDVGTLDGKDCICLEVSDDGPGVPESERNAIFRRFHRVASTGGRGSGIGLSLVAAIAEQHQALLKTSSGIDGKGFAVRVLFPIPSQAGAAVDHQG